MSKINPFDSILEEKRKMKFNEIIKESHFCCGCGSSKIKHEECYTNLSICSHPNCEIRTCFTAIYDGYKPACCEHFFGDDEFYKSLQEDLKQRKITDKVYQF